MSRVLRLLVVPLLVLTVAAPAATAVGTDRPGDPGDHTWLNGDTLARWPCGPLPDEYAVGVGGASVAGRRLSDGRVVINGPMLASFEDGFGEGPLEGIQGTRGQVLMHEIGHALGLGHAADASQIMYPVATRKPAAWGAGDHHRLRILGRGRCERG